MQKTTILLIGLLLPLQTHAIETNPLRAEESALIRDGQITKTTIISDQAGTVFIEFIKDTNVVISETKIRFEGEILPPEIIPSPTKPPRARMREFLTFELLSNTGDEIKLVNHLRMKTRKSRARQRINDPDQYFAKTMGATILIRISEDDDIKMPALWEFQSETNDWRRIGGTTKQSSDPDIKIFSAYITKTGIYSIIDEDPPGSFHPSFPIDQVQLVEPSPYPSVEPPEETTIPDDFPPPEELPETLTEEGMVPAIEDFEETPENISDTEMIAAIEEEEQQEIEIQETEQTPEQNLQTSVITPPKDAILPKSGKAESKNKPKKKSPWTIPLAIAALTGTAYITWKNKRLNK